MLKGLESLQIKTIDIDELPEGTNPFLFETV